MPDNRISAPLKTALVTALTKIKKNSGPGNNLTSVAEAKRHLTQNVTLANAALKLLAESLVMPPIPQPPDPVPDPGLPAVFPFSVVGEKLQWPTVAGAEGYRVYDEKADKHLDISVGSTSWTAIPRYPGETVKYGWAPVIAGVAHWQPRQPMTFAGTPTPDPVPAPVPGPPPPSGGFILGTVLNSDQDKALANSKAVGANFVRMEFSNDDSASSVKAMVDKARSAGMKVIVQSADPWNNLSNVVAWGKLLGNSIIGIEFGNEDSFEYKGATTAKGEQYGRNYKTVHDALGGATSLLAQGDDPHGVNWTNAVKVNAGTVDGWVTHPYGPQSRADSTLDHIMDQTTGPVWITEWGLATDNGAMLSNNYDWPRNQTYQQAADALENSLSRMVEKYPRLRGMAYFQAHDQTPPGDGEREHYFGLRKNDSIDKGPLTAKYRQLAGVYR